MCVKSAYEKYGSACDVRYEPYTEKVKPPSTIQQALALERELDQQNRVVIFESIDNHFLQMIFLSSWKRKAP